MTDAPLLETKLFGQPGFLYPYDIRYDERDLAYCNPLPNGSVQLCLWSEPALVEAVLVYNDGRVRAAPMEPALASHGAVGDDDRFVYWQTTIQPIGRRLTYSFAFKDWRGRPVYFCRHGIDHAVEPLDRWALDMEARAPFETPDWIKGALVYQIFPERFANGDQSNDPPGAVPWGSPAHWFEFQGGDLVGIMERLDYLQELGVDVLYLNPVFSSPSNHKYDTVDYYHVDPALGGNEALRALVEALHRRDMRIILDASFNHCHPRFFAFQDVVRRGADSPYLEWFTFYELPVRLRYRPAKLSQYWRHWIEFAPEHLGIPIQAVDEADGNGPPLEPTYEAWYGVPNMPKLNQRNPETRQYFLDVAAHWLREFHIDGWRMDVARHVEADFWRDFRCATKAVRPDCYLLSEIWGDTSPWLQGDQFDATMNYLLRDLALGYFAQETLDTPTFLSGLLRVLARYAPQVTAVTHNLLSSHDTERFLTMCDGDLTRFQLATLLQLTLPGAPGVYYGDEIGMEGGHDPDCRRAFPWDRPDGWNRELLAFVKGLARLRHTHPAMRYGDFFLVWQGEEAFAFLRRFEGQTILVYINRGGATARLHLPVATSSPVMLWGDVQVALEKGQLLLEDVPAQMGAVIGL